MKKEITCEDLSDYVHWSLGCFFSTYPKEHVRQLYGYFLKAKNILITDIKSKYSTYDVQGLDGKRFFSLLQLDACMEAVFYYRLERAIFLDNPENPILPYLASLMRMKTGIELYYSTEIGPGLNVQHGTGIVVGARYKIGSNFVIHQGVSLGQKNMDISASAGTITIGDNVCIFAGAKIIGDLRIGDNVLIGANAVLLSDADSNSTYVGVPARKVRGHGLCQCSISGNSI